MILKSLWLYTESTNEIAVIIFVFVQQQLPLESSLVLLPRDKFIFARGREFFAAYVKKSKRVVILISSDLFFLSSFKIFPFLLFLRSSSDAGRWRPFPTNRSLKIPLQLAQQVHQAQHFSFYSSL